MDDAIKSIVDYLTEKNLKDVVLVGHSYGGMVITGVADRVPERLRRLVYWNAFVPNNGESLNDMVPPPYVALFDAIAAQRGDISVVLPFPIWREAFINDVDLATAKKAYDILNPHPVKTFSDKISLKTDPADMQIAQVLHQLHRRHCTTASLSVASAAVAEARTVPAGSGARQSRALLLQSEAAGAGDHGRRKGLRPQQA